MSDRKPIKLDKSQVRSLCEWFLFQENGDIHSGETTLKIEEVKLSDKLNKAYIRLLSNKKAKVLFEIDDAFLAIEWFEKLPNSLKDNHDYELNEILGEFCRTG